MIAKEILETYKNLGSYVLLIKDDPWEAIVPGVEGLINYAIDADLEIRERWYTVNGKKIPEVNILWFVKGLTSEIAENMDTRELIMLLKDFLFGRKTVSSLKRYDDNPLLARANEDYDDAVYNLFKKQPDYNSSQKASLKFSEKILESRLESEGKALKGNHNLLELANKLEDINTVELGGLFDSIECSVNTVGDKPDINRDEAANAVRSSLVLFSRIFPEVKG